MTKFSISSAIGNTPLIRLNTISNQIKRNVFAKLEFMNPGGSVKDRCAKYIIESAERQGLITPGVTTLIEGTLGNTGIGLLLFLRAKGYQCLFFIPENISIEKCNLLKNMGAKVERTPLVPETDPAYFINRCKSTLKEMENGYFTNQFDNLLNMQSHYETTGPEIWSQLDGKVDAFVCASGSGGTISGVSSFLKEKDPSVHVVLADRPGSVNYSYIKTKGKEIESIEGITTVVEGVGKPSITGNLRQVCDNLIDDSIKIEDLETVTTYLRVLQNEGLFIAGSGGLNIAAAIRVLKTLPENSNVVTMMPDGGQKYLNKLYSKKFMESVGIYGELPSDLQQFLT